MQNSECKKLKRVLFAFCILHFALLSAPLLGQGADEALNAGFAALQKSDADRAATLFRRALAVEPEHPAALYGAGAAAHLQGRETDAVSFLKRALQSQPALWQASALLGDILYHQGDLTLAVKTYESALALSPGNVQLRERLAAWRSEATVQDNLHALKDDRFTILFDGPANQELAVRATIVLRNAFWRIGQVLRTYPATSINVIFYTRQQFRDITGAPEWAGAGFDGQIRMPVAGATQNLQQFDRVLTHELAHAMVASVAARNVPAWLHEGLAMYFDGNNPAASEKRLVAAHVFIPLANLQGGFGGLTSQQANLAYDMSAFALGALMTRIGASNLGVLLQDLDRGQTVDTALQRFGVTFADFEAQLAKRIGITRK
jgi:tetratricopeptide (TPR) repeat protein